MRTVTPIRGRRCQERAAVLADGRTIGVTHWPGRGRALVLLHGFMDSSHGWDGVANATERPVWALDLPGFGRSDLPVRPRVHCYAQDVLATLDALEVERFVLVGHSMGGMIATRVAEEAPDRVEALVLLAPAGFSRLHLADLANLPVVSQVTDRAVRLGMRVPVTRALTYRLAVANGHAMPAELAARLGECGAHWGRGARVGLATLAAHNNSRRAYWRRQIDYHGPVRVLWGDRDALVPLLMGHARNLRRAFPQADVTVWKGMGHHPQVEEPTRLSAWLEDACPRGRTRARRAA